MIGQNIRTSFIKDALREQRCFIVSSTGMLEVKVHKQLHSIFFASDSNIAVNT